MGLQVKGMERRVDDPCQRLAETIGLPWISEAVLARRFLHAFLYYINPIVRAQAIGFERREEDRLQLLWMRIRRVLEQRAVGVEGHKAVLLKWHVMLNRVSEVGDEVETPARQHED